MTHASTRGTKNGNAKHFFIVRARSGAIRAGFFVVVAVSYDCENATGRNRSGRAVRTSSTWSLPVRFFSFPPSLKY